MNGLNIPQTIVLALVIGFAGLAWNLPPTIRTVDIAFTVGTACTIQQTDAHTYQLRCVHSTEEVVDVPTPAAPEKLVNQRDEEAKI